MSYKMTGTIVTVGEKNQVSDKFAKRDVVISDNADKYPQEVSFQFTQDKCDLLENLREGQEVEISFNLKGRSWTSPQGEVKYFNTLEGWKIEAVGGSTPQPVAQPVVVATEEEGDLPF